MSIFGDIAHAIGSAAKGVAHAVEGAVKTIAGDVEHAVKLAEHVASGFIHGVGRVLVAEGTVIINAVVHGEQLFAKLIDGAIGVRPLRPDEKAVAQAVFGNTVPLNHVVIASLSGFGNRPFTVPGSMIGTLALLIPGIGPLISLTAVLGNLLDKYIIFLGKEGYKNALHHPFDGGVSGSTFIHEMTHVWQGHNQSFAWSYVGNSVACQCRLGSKRAYQYTAGNQWQTYNAEPQAQIVEHWYQHHVAPGFTLPPAGTPLAEPFKDWNSPSNPIAPAVYQAYIDSNVRPGKPHATTVFPKSPLTSHVASALKTRLLTPAVLATHHHAQPASALLAAHHTPPLAPLYNVREILRRHGS